MESNAAANIGSVNSSSTTVTVPNESRGQQPDQLILRLRSSPQKSPRVSFANDVIDNEHLGRLKSNCCCIYVRPRVWDDPSTWEQDEHETDHCRGHTLPDPAKQPKRDNNEHGNNCC